MSLPPTHATVKFPLLLIPADTVSPKVVLSSGFTWKAGPLGVPDGSYTRAITP